MALEGTFMRGCVPSPRHKLAMAAWAGAALKAVVAPSQFATLCKDYDISGNDRYGDCVSAEESNAKRAYSVALGVPEIEIPGATVVAWARKHGYLNGANLADVLAEMQTVGMTDAAGNVHCDGTHATVDWTNQTELQTAIFVYKTVKIAVAATQLERAMSSGNGWMLLTARHDMNTDHCVGLHGYGPLSFLAQLCGVAVPAGRDPAMPCFLLYTWGTVAIISWDALQAIMAGGEAWIRDPGDLVNGQPPVPVNPPVPDVFPGPPLVAGILPPGIPYFGCYDKAGNPLWDIKKWPWSAPLVKSVGGIADNVALANLYDALRGKGLTNQLTGKILGIPVDLTLNTRIPG